MTYCPSPYVYQRRKSRVVQVGNVPVGGEHPIRVQSMITCDTMDTAASIQQTLDLAAVGCEIVRITAPTVKDAANLQHIVAGLRERGCQVPIVADIHFKPDAAMEAAKWVEKVRVNPGNYADSKKFKIVEYTDEQYAAELERIRERFSPLVELCKANGRAMRIGTNHGSLSDRIMNRYGDTPLGMVESALEFARIARDLGYHDFMFSMKSSNPKVMIEAYRLLVSRLYEEGPDWNYPIHLGVTEAGDGEDGRIKSAIGIGSLLSDGIGDTIRVSLTEDSIHEIPVAQALIARVDEVAALSPPVDSGKASKPADGEWSALSFDPFSYRRRAAARIAIGDIALGGEETIRVFTSQEKWDALAHKLDRMGDFRPELAYEQSGVREVDPTDDATIEQINQAAAPQLVTVQDVVALPVIAAYRMLAAKLDPRHPILLKDTLPFRVGRKPGPRVRELYRQAVPIGDGMLRVEIGPRLSEIIIPQGSAHDEKISKLLDSNVDVDLESRPAPIHEDDFLTNLLRAATNIGALLCDGIGDAVLVQGEAAPGQSLRLAYNVLQAAGARIFKTDYVACPSCGRTLFNLQTTTAKIRAATTHLKGVKIAIMGCIVNGPGEMADADFGYVGGAPGKVNLYVGKTPVKFNIPEVEAVDRLQDLIREHGKWVDAPAAQPVAVS
jgi:(E)-4-hydroxy-3-methylbut-2-enyl-diphosphate synthase